MKSVWNKFEGIFNKEFGLPRMEEEEEGIAEYYGRFVYTVDRIIHQNDVILKYWAFGGSDTEVLKQTIIEALEEEQVLENMREDMEKKNKPLSKYGMFVLDDMYTQLEALLKVINGR